MLSGVRSNNQSDSSVFFWIACNATNPENEMDRDVSGPQFKPAITGGSTQRLSPALAGQRKGGRG